MSFAIKVNGNTHSVDVDGDTPLLWVLRDVLGMTGTKFGCGAALCGACTVHVDGMATRSCVTPIDSVGGSAIAEGDPRQVVGDPHARYFGTELEEGSLTPGRNPHIGSIRFDQWLNRALAAA